MLEEDNISEQLTERQELFCQEFLQDLNATKAYMRAYENDNYTTCATNASRLLKNAYVHARIKELQKERADALMLDATYVLENLIAVHQRAQQAEPVKVWNHETKQLEETGKYVFDSNGANKSLELLGKHLGMWKDKVEHSGEVGITPIIIQGQKFADKDDKE